MIEFSSATRNLVAAVLISRLWASASLTVRVRSASPNSESQPLEIRPSAPLDAAAQFPGVRIEASLTGAANRHDSQPETTRLNPAIMGRYGNCMSEDDESRIGRKDGSTMRPGRKAGLTHHNEDQFYRKAAKVAKDAQRGPLIPLDEAFAFLSDLGGFAVKIFWMIRVAGCSLLGHAALPERGGRHVFRPANDDSRVF